MAFVLTGRRPAVPVFRGARTFARPVAPLGRAMVATPSVLRFAPRPAPMPFAPAFRPTIMPMELPVRMVNGGPMPEPQRVTAAAARAELVEQLQQGPPAPARCDRCVPVPRQDVVPVVVTAPQARPTAAEPPAPIPAARPVGWAAALAGLLLLAR